MTIRLTSTSYKRLRMFAEVNKREFNMIKLRNEANHMYLGTCCNQLLNIVKKNVDFGSVVIKNVPVGVCLICGEEYYDLFFMANLEQQPLSSLHKILS